MIGEIIVTLTSIIPLGIVYEFQFLSNIYLNNTVENEKILGAPNLVGPCIGLIIIAIGTGGIKPCVSAFGGNQFEKSQTRYIETFFSVFYLSINVGSTIATLVTPIFRGDVKCFGNNCYPLVNNLYLEKKKFILIMKYYFNLGVRSTSDIHGNNDF